MRNPRLLWAPVLAIGLALSACKVEVKDKGKLPDVDVHDGRAPKVDVKPAEIKVTTDTQKVVVPDVDVTSPEDSTH
ncbi:MAG TPA: hypothetical protein VFL93_08945 [Longimicrobiaceae bacterium]|jgi:hypothetical protein|nr:hypothetical protein [Longimicrobiaceae bacterium]